MARTLPRVLFALVASAACAPARAAGDDGPCSARALKLGAAKPVAALPIPTGCTVRGAGDEPVLVRTRAALDQHLACPAGAAPAIDFERQALVVVSRMLSPATVGIDAFDDGKVVTLVTRSRRPCPDDPRPMPTPASYLYVVGAQPTRGFAEAQCTTDSRCR